MWEQLRENAEQWLRIALGIEYLDQEGLYGRECYFSVYVILSNGVNFLGANQYLGKESFSLGL
jgi:hypothetical protein